MSRIKLDLSKVKYLSGDDKTTQLEHADGHTITLVHKALSKDSQEQLAALAKVSKKEPKNESLKQSKEEVAQDMPVAAEAAEVPQMFAEKGMVEDPDEIDKPLPELPEVPINMAPLDVPGLPQSFVDMPNNAAPDYTNIAASGARADKMAPMDAQLPTSAPADGLMVDMSGPSRGLAQAPTAEPTADASAMDLSQSAMPDGTQMQMDAANMQAKAMSDLGKAEAKQREQYAIDMAEAKKTYDQQWQALDQDRQMLMDELKNGDINPEAYWTGDKNGNGSHSKIASAIGIILAGFNPTTAPNAAINLLKYQMDKSMEAQMANLGKKKTLLEANLRQFGNIEQAMNMTRVNMNDAVINQLQIAAANAKTPLAKAAAMDAIGKVSKQSQADAQKVVMGRMVGMLNSNKLAPGVQERMLEQLEATNPEAVKGMRERHIPGVGFANSNEGAKVVRDMKAKQEIVRDSVAKLNGILSKTGKSLSLKDRAQADTIRRNLVGALRTQVVGPGAMSEKELGLMLDIIPDVTALFSFDSSTRTRLKELQSQIDNGYVKAAQANGLKIQSGAPSAGQDKNAQAKAWLQANPNHPQAAAIRKKLGM